MNRQVNFFLHPHDQQEFDAFLKTFDDIVFIPYYHHSDKITLIQDTIVRDFIKEGARVYLARRSDLAKIRLDYIAPQKYWLVNSNTPTLDFDRSIFRENSIHSGRLYFQPKFVENMQWVDKSEDFVKWSDNIIKATRRKLKKYKHELGAYTYTALLGNKALDWMKANNADIQGGGHILTPCVTQ
ncbi:hypothetical protein [Desertivirga brevis]|uniref:hypothetical protein n=1 Tax=Desertivirga brevis TaxID=2810310 RepID=UPI001A96E579|nr:hypothetical protein [Pedobacter sp. SYSU D00873]